MNLIDMVQRLRSGEKVAEMSERIARDLHERVWQRVAERAHYLGLSELRGYVRARAAILVHHEVAVACESANLPVQDLLTDAVHQAIVRRMVTQARQLRSAGVTTRRAA